MVITQPRAQGNSSTVITNKELNSLISLFQASTCFEHMCSSSGGQKLYYTVSGIITPIGDRHVHRLREEYQRLYNTIFGPPDDEHM